MKKSLKKIEFNKEFFYYGLLFIPLLHFCVFYIYANFDSIYMSFTNFNYDSGAYEFSGFATFKALFYKFDTIGYYWGSVFRSVKLLCYNLLIGIPLPLVLAYYLYKKSVGSGFFKIILFLPSMLSSIVLVTIFRNFVEYALPVFGEMVGLKIPNDLIFNPQKSFVVTLCYSLWLGFGAQIILYTGAMSAISDSVIEAGALDGANSIREFWSIVVPSVWSTIVTFVVVTISGTFNNMMHLFDFYGGGASEDIMTLGYYLYKKINSQNTSISEYPELSAIGLLCTVVTFIVVMIVKRFMEKFGPSEE